MQQLLPTFDPSEQDLVDRALAEPFCVKVDKLIKNMQLFKPAIVRDSAGKDSGVVGWAADKAGIDHKKTYSNTTIDPPELVDFLKTFHPKTEWIDSGRGHLILDRMVEKMNLPTRRAKWCCDEYKNCCSGKSCEFVTKCVGVRISESARRAGAWKLITKMKSGETIFAPIAYWTDEDVWQLTHEEGIPYCSLYDEGFSRLGCVGCPIAGEKRQRLEFERWPQYEAMWREGIRRVWESAKTRLRRDGKQYSWVKFQSPEDMFDWWLTGKKNEPEPNCVFEEMMENV